MRPIFGSSLRIVKNTLKGIRRTLGTATVQKTPALIDDVRAMIAATGVGLIGTRDRAGASLAWVRRGVPAF